MNFKKDLTLAILESIKQHNNSQKDVVPNWEKIEDAVAIDQLNKDPYKPSHFEKVKTNYKVDLNKACFYELPVVNQQKYLSYADSLVELYKSNTLNLENVFAARLKHSNQKQTKSDKVEFLKLTKSEKELYNNHAQIVSDFLSFDKLPDANNKAELDSALEEQQNGYVKFGDAVFYPKYETEDSVSYKLTGRPAHYNKTINKIKTDLTTTLKPIIFAERVESFEMYFNMFGPESACIVNAIKVLHETGNSHLAYAELSKTGLPANYLTTLVRAVTVLSKTGTTFYREVTKSIEPETEAQLSVLDKQNLIYANTKHS